MSTTALAALLKPILTPFILLAFFVIARCGLLLARKLPDCWLRRLLTRDI